MVFDIHDASGIQLLSRISLNFRHLNEHKFRHNFNDMVDHMCTCGLEQEALLHSLLRSNLYSTQRLEPLNNVCILNRFLKNYSNEKLLNIVLYGSEDFHFNLNKELLKATIKIIKIYESFNSPLFWPFLKNICPNNTYFLYIF